MIRLHVLGGVELSDAAGRPLQSVLAQPKRLALLTYLAIAPPRGFHRRDTLLALFWPELDHERARGALNQAVYHLRRSLGRDVIVSRGPGDLAVDATRLWCDAPAFEQALDVGRTRDALELYRADLLTGFFLSDALDWERWMEAERDRLRGRAAAGAWLLAQEALEQGLAREAAAFGRRSLALSPGDEPRLRQLLVLLDGIGDRVGALRTYDDVVAEWARDEIEPARETQELIASIRAGRDAAGTVAGIAGPAVRRSQMQVATSDGVEASAGVAAQTSAASRSGALRLATAAAIVSAAVLVIRPVVAPNDATEGTGAGGPSADGKPGEGAAFVASRPAARPVTSRFSEADLAEAGAEYLKGRHFLGRLDAEAFEKARAHFQRSLELVPTSADAWSGLAEAYIQLTSVMALPAREGYPRARAAAERALELEPATAEAHAALAMAHAMYYWDTNAAEHHFRRGLQLDSMSARTRRMYAAHLRNLGRFEEALQQIRAAQSLDPFFSFAHVEEAITLYAARRYNDALSKLTHFLQVSPDQTHAYVFIAMVCLQQGRFDDALDALRRVDPRSERPDALAKRGEAYAQLGRSAEARRMLARLDSLAAGRASGNAIPQGCDPYGTGRARTGSRSPGTGRRTASTAAAPHRCDPDVGCVATHAAISGAAGQGGSLAMTTSLDS